MMKSPRFDEIQADILKTGEAGKINWDRRRRILRKLETVDGNRSVAVYFCRPEMSISQADILPFSSMLTSVGVVQNLDLVVVSNGGDGITAEKMLDLCRKHCTGLFRVVVPLYAKSAATLLALGADEIVMGETSELGPIDAQIFIIQDNSPQQVSADHMLRAKESCVKDLASHDQAVVQAAQIQLSLLSPAFLQQCDDLMNFGRDFAAKQLKAHMFKQEFNADSGAWGPKIDKIVQNLAASSNRLSHGRMITAGDIVADADLQALKVKSLDNSSEYWTLLSEFLLRSEIVAQFNEFGKILCTKNFQLVGAAG